MGDCGRFLATSDEQERQSIVCTSCFGSLLKNVPICFYSLFGHADARVRDRDLLKNHCVAGGLFERQAKRRERLMELALSQQLEAFVVVGDTSNTCRSAKKLCPPGHSGKLGRKDCAA